MVPVAIICTVAMNISAAIVSTVLFILVEGLKVVLLV